MNAGNHQLCRRHETPEKTSYLAPFPLKLILRIPEFLNLRFKLVLPVLRLRPVDFHLADARIERVHLLP